MKIDLLPTFYHERNPQAAGPPPEDDRTGSSVETLKRAVADNLFYVQGKLPAIANPHDVYLAWAFTARDRLLHRWIQTAETYLKQQSHKLVCYLSAEYLLGPQLGDNLLKLDLHDHAQKAAEASGLDLSALLEQESEPGLGDGGLARLAATYLRVTPRALRVGLKAQVLAPQASVS